MLSLVRNLLSVFSSASLEEQLYRAIGKEVSHEIE
jgi:hypothetical protein